MSFVNTDTICMPCRYDEKELPDYDQYREAELVAVKAGNFNFPGVGLSAEDETFLSVKRGQRVMET